MYILLHSYLITDSQPDHFTSIFFTISIPTSILHLYLVSTSLPINGYNFFLWRCFYDDQIIVVSYFNVCSYFRTTISRICRVLSGLCKCNTRGEYGNYLRRSDGRRERENVCVRVVIFERERERERERESMRDRELQREREREGEKER